MIISGRRPRSPAEAELLDDTPRSPAKAELLDDTPRSPVKAELLEALSWAWSVWSPGKRWWCEFGSCPEL